MQDPTEQESWTRRWKRYVRTTQIPGVYTLREGGHLVRARVTDPRTGRVREIRRILPKETAEEASNWLARERDRAQFGRGSALQVRPRFADFAMTVLDRRIATLELASPKSRERWAYTLEHLIGGTVSADGSLYVRGFGELWMHEIRATHVKDWKAEVGKLIGRGDYSPHTVNGWLSVLRVIAGEARTDLELSASFTDGVGNFPTADCVTYSDESPNSLGPDDVARFLSALREMYPQHYAMACLGFATGLRPSSLRPLRRRGAKPDLVPSPHGGVLRVRRSHALGTDVLNRTKQGTRYAIELPSEVVDMLQWHIETQLNTREQRASELLFPSVTGGFRSPSVLNKPFAAVGDAIGLPYSFTQRGMRRTFNDLARAARVESIVTRSISGHLTPRMQDHYSTVRGEEQREGIGRVINLMRVQRAS